MNIYISLLILIGYFYFFGKFFVKKIYNENSFNIYNKIIAFLYCLINIICFVLIYFKIYFGFYFIYPSILIRYIIKQNLKMKLPFSIEIFLLFIVAFLPGFVSGFSFIKYRKNNSFNKKYFLLSIIMNVTAIIIAFYCGTKLG